MDLSGIKVVGIAIILLVAGIGSGFVIGFGIYQQRISNLEGQNSQLQGQVSDLEGNFSDLQSKSENLTSQITDLQSQNSQLQGQISTLQTNITELQAYIAELEEHLAVTWDEIVDRGYISVGSSPDWPPFESLDPVTGEFVGFEVDIMEEVMSRLGLEENVTITVNWVSMPFASIKEAVVAKTVDLGVSGFAITPERLELVQFCTPHYVTDAQVLALNSTVATAGIPPEGLESLAELKTYGLSCGVESGTTQEEELLAAGVTTVAYVDYWAAMDDMIDGSVDTVYAESPVSYYWIQDYANQTPPIGMQIIFSRPYWPVGFMAHHDSDVLVAKISGVIAELRAEGWIDEKIIEYGMVY